MTSMSLHWGFTKPNIAKPRQSETLLIGFSHTDMSHQMRSINTICIRIRIMSEKFCLQWDDFQGNIKEVLGMFKGDLDFADVTLACEDGHQVEANKIILAASSPLFLSLLKRNKHSHPIIYMRGMKAEDLNNIALCNKG